MNKLEKLFDRFVEYLQSRVDDTETPLTDKEMKEIREFLKDQDIGQLPVVDGAVSKLSASVPFKVANG